MGLEVLDPRRDGFREMTIVEDSVENAKLGEEKRQESGEYNRKIATTRSAGGRVMQKFIPDH